MDQKKPEEPKKEEGKTEDKNSDESKAAPRQEIILRVYMHCEGCAGKIRRCLKGFVGVEDVQTDCTTHKVVVKGEKADPLKVLERVQRKSHRQVELLYPTPQPPAVDEPQKETEEEKTPVVEEQNIPQVITVTLNMYMHCEACAQEIKRRILKMEGVVKVDADLKASHVTVNGTFDPPKLLEYVHKRTGKQAVILKEEVEKAKDAKEEVEKPKEETKGGDGEKVAPEVKGEKGDAGTVVEEAKPPPPTEGEGKEGKEVKVKKDEVYYNNNPMNFQTYPPRFATEMYAGHHGYAPQMFSDENPNACSVM